MSTQDICFLGSTRTIFFAGHETTASSLVWALYELARHPEYQTKVRDEIKATRARVAERGDGELTIADLDSMQYLPALMKASYPFDWYLIPQLTYNLRKLSGFTRSLPRLFVKLVATITYPYLTLLNSPRERL